MAPANHEAAVAERRDVDLGVGLADDDLRAHPLASRVEALDAGQDWRAGAVLRQPGGNEAATWQRIDHGTRLQDHIGRIELEIAADRRAGRSVNLAAYLVRPTTDRGSPGDQD